MADRIPILGVSLLAEAGAVAAPRPPRTTVEQAVVDIWRQVLPERAIGPDSDFFDLGGESLRATQIAARVQAVLGVALDLRVLLDQPTPAAMAVVVEAALQAGPPPAVAAMRVVDRSQPLPLSFTQERLWFIHQLDPDNAAYTVATAVRLRGAVDLAALETAFSALVARHETLRTTFQLVAGEPRQIIGAAQPFRVAVVAADSPAAAQALAERDAQRPFDLAHGPLLRATLYLVDAGDQVLLLAMHHIISDAWSLGVLAREVLAEYQAAQQGVPANLPPLPVQMADFAAWQRTALSGAALERELAYWRPQLAGLPRLELPLDLPRPAIQRYHGALASAGLDPALLQALRGLSQAAGATLTMTLLAAFQVLLQRYTGQDDVAVGLPIANRRAVALEGLIGAFVNTLVLRVDLSGQPSFRALLARVRQAALEAYAHQDMPFAQLVAELNPERSLSHSPLVTVMFNHLNVPQPTAPAAGLAADGLVLDRGAAQFDLTLTVLDPGPTSRRERLVIEYNTELLEAATVARLLRHYLQLLHAIAADPDQQISTLPLLDATERRQMLVEWNATTRPYPNASLPDLFEAQAARTPDAPALLAGDQALSYTALNARANQLAHALQRFGGGPGSVVGVCLPRSFDQIAAVLAVLKTGAAYLPLDPAYPAARLQAMLTDSEAALVLTDAAGAAGLPALEGVRHLLLDRLVEAPAAADGRANLGVPIALDAPAYLLYTSGSSGLPKGVLAPHRGAVNHCQWVWDQYPFAAGEVAAHKDPSLNFVDAVVEIFSPLLAGVPLVLVPEPVVRDPAALVARLAEAGVTRLLLLPALLRAMLSAAPDLRARLPRLALVAVSGEPLTAALLDQFQVALPGVPLLNWYGTSEVAGDVSSYDSRDPRPPAGVPIGRPLANTQLYVLDPATLEPVPVGVAGEIYVGGAGLALGYYRRPDLDAERFVANPFRVGTRLYRTGDRGCWRADGSLLYRGRRDRQVKVRGVRLELEDVQAGLAQHPALAASAVTMHARGPGADPDLAVYYVARPGMTLAPGEVRRHLAQRLPESLLPMWIVPLPELPRLPNGKVDRAGLPAPEALHRGAAAGERVAPRTLLEAGLAEVWAEQLGVPAVGVTDNFFELGGHSLLAASLFARLKAALGVDLPVAALFAAPTVAGLAAALVRGGQAPAGLSALVPLQPAGDRLPFFCVHPLGGGVGDYAALAHHLHPQQPFYGLRAKGLDDERWQAASFEALAADYVADLRQLQPTGPYRLGGYSSGGLIAYEMARQMTAAGEAVALVALLDSYAPAAPGRRRSSLAAARSRVTSLPLWLRDLSRLGRDQLLDRLRYWRRAAQAGRTPLTAGDYLGETQLRQLPPRHRAFVDAHWRARAAYHPQPYAGRVTLFRAQAQALSRADDPDKGWGALALGGVDIREFPGSHRTLLTEPWVRGLAAVLQQKLDELDAA